MLGKLIKYEWKSVYKVGCVILLVVMAFTLLGAVVFHTPMWSILFSDDTRISDGQMLFWVMTGFSSFLLYVLMLVGATYGIIIYLGVHFHKTMYTDEGYLSHTLPVTPHQLLISKFLVGGIWVLFIQLAVTASVLILVASLFAAIENAEPNVFGGQTYWEMFSEIFEIISDDMGFEVVHYTISFILTVIISPFSSIASLFGALTIGQLSRKHKAMMGIITYFGILFATSILSSIVQSIGTVSAYVIDDYRIGSSNFTLFLTRDIQIIIPLLTGVGLYFLSHYIIDRKLNLE